jgi:hypothetical protein
MSPERSVKDVFGPYNLEVVGAKGFEPSTSWSRTRNQIYLGRCPGVSYGFSGRSQLDKFGQVFQTFGANAFFYPTEFGYPIMQTLLPHTVVLKLKAIAPTRINSKLANRNTRKIVFAHDSTAFANKRSIPLRVFPRINPLTVPPHHCH